ncbi:MAG: phosphotransferase [Pseudorhodobacter sp.]|nr:phosphotransferase [Pseudorhodobacter sp.]
MQTAVLMHLMAVDPSLPVPRVCQTLSGQAMQMIAGAAGQNHVVRLLTFLDGTVLGTAVEGVDLHHDIGALLARLTHALRGFFHPAAGHVLQWDIKQAHRLRPMLDAVEDANLHRRMTDLLDRFEAEIAPRLASLRAQIVHNDFNPHNLLVDAPQATRLTGVIDFGDMVHTPIVCDLAVACSYQITGQPQPMGDIAKMIAGYTSILPLEKAELELLPDLMRLRHATTLTISAWRAQRYPENAAYIRRNADASLRGLNALDNLGTAAGHHSTAQCGAPFQGVIPMTMVNAYDSSQNAQIDAEDAALIARRDRVLGPGLSPFLSYAPASGPQQRCLALG